MPRPRTTPLAAYADIADIARQRDQIPSNRDLAEKHHISESYVRHLMKQARKGLLSLGDVSRGTNEESGMQPNTEVEQNSLKTQAFAV